MKFRSYILLFSTAIFILAALGLVIIYLSKSFLTFWGLVFVYAIAMPCVFAFFVEPLSKLGWKKILLLTFSVTIIAIAVTHSVWTIITPNWSFSVTTDKPTYKVGEHVQITVSLENLGFISHSFASSISEPIVISISDVYEKNPTVTTQAWFSPFHSDKTKFIISPHQFLNRTFTWNQTNIHQPEKKTEPGVYLIEALIPCADSDMPIGVDNLFWAWKYINITAT